VRAERVGDGVWRVLKGYVNAYAIEAEDGLVLVDCGLPKREERIARALRDMGRRAAEIRHILVTHHHLDHTGSLAALAELTGAAVYVHPLDAGVVRGDAMPPPPNRAVWSGRWIGPVLARVGPKRARPAAVDRELHDGDVLDLAGGIRVVHTPGHTAGQTSFLLERDGGILLAGDAAGSRSGKVAPPVGSLFGMFTEDLDAARRSFAKLAGLEFDVALFGHGSPVRGGAAEVFRRSRPPAPG
jgi:glyoxylase-like metal-dependent hydrolase (beta-lactamase superfamily II)